MLVPFSQRREVVWIGGWEKRGFFNVEFAFCADFGLEISITWHS